MKLQFNSKAFLGFLLFLLIEIGIGMFVNDSFIRPFGGDFLVIFLLYYLAKSFIKTQSLNLILIILVFAYVVETAQYFKIADLLQVKNKVLRIIIGTSFSWGDIGAYTLGAISCYFIDKTRI